MIIEQIKENITDKHFYKYLGIGVVNTIVGYSIIFSLMYIGLNAFMSNFTGYLIGITVSYYLNKKFNFKSNKPHKEVFPKFFLSLFVAYLSNLGVLAVSIKLLMIDKYISQIIAGIIYVIIGFLGSKYFTFYNKNL